MAPEEQAKSALPVRRYEYETSTLMVADLGGPGVDADVDVLDDTLIIVVDGPDGEAQYDLDRPVGGVANTFINNGILTIEVNTK